MDGLRAAEFHVVYQPIVHAETRRLTGVECLLRWRHPQYGLLLPGSFISAFDNHEVAREASRFVLESACRQLSEAQRAGQVLPRVAVNIQPSELLGDTLSGDIAELTAQYGIDSSLLELELLESEDVSKLLSLQQFTHPLKQLGVRIALDDFGSGYSSLAALASIPADTIKVARGFLTRLPDSERACTLMNGVLDLLNKLGMTIVVEGVETAAQLEWLSRHENIHLQGYFLARPKATLAEAIAAC
nr:EAL domain-containing protein [Paraburkholderia bryophila]